MSDGVATRLGRDVEGARVRSGRVDSCLNDGRGAGARRDGRSRVVIRRNEMGQQECLRRNSCLRRNDGRGSRNDGWDSADADEGAGMTRPMPALVTRL